MNIDKLRIQTIVILIIALRVSINLLCRIYPNDAELGKIIRKHFQKL